MAKGLQSLTSHLFFQNLPWQLRLFSTWVLQVLWEPAVEFKVPSVRGSRNFTLHFWRSLYKIHLLARSLPREPKRQSTLEQEIYHEARKLADTSWQISLWCCNQFKSLICHGDGCWWLLWKPWQKDTGSSFQNVDSYWSGNSSVLHSAGCLQFPLKS